MALVSFNFRKHLKSWASQMNRLAEVIHWCSFFFSVSQRIILNYSLSMLNIDFKKVKKYSTPVMWMVLTCHLQSKMELVKNLQDEEHCVQHFPTIANRIHLGFHPSFRYKLILKFRFSDDKFDANHFRLLRPLFYSLAVWSRRFLLS